jgi:hypothetical protein
LPFALTILWACACSEPRTAPQAGSQGAGGEETVRIVFSLPGDDIGSPESAAVLERVGRAVTAAGAGENLGSGFGMGSMELVVRTRAADSRAALERIIREEYPAARYRIERGGR